MPFLERYPTKWGKLWNSDPDQIIIPNLGGKVLSWTARNNVTAQSLIDKGITHVAQNTGTQGPGIPYPHRSVFIENPDWIKRYGQPRGKLLKDFNENDCKEAVQNEYNTQSQFGKVTCITTGSSENNNNNKDWAQITYDDPNGPRYNATQQYHWIDREWSRLCRLNGGEYYGDYDGFEGLTQGLSGQFNRNVLNTIRPAFLSGQEAYNRIKASAPSGGGNTYFTQDAFEYRSGLIRTYWDNSVEGSERLFRIIFGATLAKKALVYKNNTTSKFLSFAWAGRNEFYNRVESYKRKPTQNSQVEDLRFPVWSFRMHTALGYLSMALMDGLYMWEDTTTYGTNPTVVAKNNPDDYNYSYTGSGATAVDRINGYQAGAQAPYPNSFDVAHNYMLQGAEWYGRAIAWASDNISYAPYRNIGGNFSSAGGDYMLDVYLNSKPFGLLHQAGNKRVLFALDMHRPAGSYQEYEFNCNGEILKINMEGQRPYLMFGEITNSQV